MNAAVWHIHGLLVQGGKPVRTILLLVKQSTSPGYRMAVLMPGSVRSRCAISDFNAKNVCTEVLIFDNQHRAVNVLITKSA